MITPRCYLATTARSLTTAAAIGLTTTAATTATIAVRLTTAAANENNCNDNPAAITTKEILIIHSETS